MAQSYVTKTPQGGYRVEGTRVSLDSVIRAWWEGELPEAIVVDFPSLNLEQVHGAIAYYLANRGEIDQYFGQQDRCWKELQRESASRLASLVHRIRSGAACLTESGAIQ